MPRSQLARLLPLSPLSLWWCASIAAGQVPPVPAAAAPAPAPGWAAASLESVGLSPAPLRQMEDAIQSGKLVKISGVLIARHGKLVYEKYFGGTTAGSLLNTRSATKTVTGMLIGIAIDRGMLPGVEAPVLAYFPDRQPVKSSDLRKQTITVEDLLTMSSPLDCDDAIEASPGNEDRMHQVDDWIRFTLDLPIKEAPQRAAAAVDSSGRRFRYCTAGVVLLGGVLERAAGTTVASFAASSLFAPLGISKAEWQFSPLGQAMTGGGLGLRGRDLLALGQLYAGGGVWNGKRVLSERWIKASTVPHVSVEGQPDTWYGYLWWLHTFKSAGRSFAAYHMAGNGGNKIAVFPELDMVVVIASTNYNTRGMHQQTERMLTDYILPAASR